MMSNSLNGCGNCSDKAYAETDLIVLSVLGFVLLFESIYALIMILYDRRKNGMRRNLRKMLEKIKQFTEEITRVASVESLQQPPNPAVKQYEFGYDVYDYSQPSGAADKISDQPVMSDTYAYTEAAPPQKGFYFTSAVGAAATTTLSKQRVNFPLPAPCIGQSNFGEVYEAPWDDIREQILTNMADNVHSSGGNDAIPDRAIAGKHPHSIETIAIITPEPPLRSNQVESRLYDQVEDSNQGFSFTPVGNEVYDDPWNPESVQALIAKCGNSPIRFEQDYRPAEKVELDGQTYGYTNAAVPQIEMTLAREFSEASPNPGIIEESCYDYSNRNARPVTDDIYDEPETLERLTFPNGIKQFSRL